MSLGSRLGRRWRSVSFRSGLVSALAVGFVATLAFLMVTALVFVLFALTGVVGQTGLVDRAEDQLLLGVAPEEVNLAGTLEVEDQRRDGGDAFWAILTGDEILNSDGDVNLAVLSAAFSDESIDFETELRPNDLVGIKAVEDQDWFYLEREVSVPDGSAFRVVTAYDGTFDLWAFTRSSLPVAIPILVILMAVAMAVTSWSTRRALRRVEHMRAEVELITQQSLNRRVPTVDAPDGIDKLAHTMNDMLERLESSTAQQSQFLADASHELRSPVAGLLAQLDVATTYPDKVDASALLPKLRNEAQRLQLLISDLLFLSRSEAAATGSGVSRLEFTPIVVSDLLAAEASRQRDIDPMVNISIDVPDNLQVSGIRQDLERALRNLADNAVRHCENEVLLAARAEDAATVIITVADDGPGVAAEDAERIFGRFVRLDEARTRDAGGSGLGLAIASEIANNHGGTVGLVPSDAGVAAGGGATFELVLST